MKLHNLVVTLSTIVMDLALLSVSAMFLYTFVGLSAMAFDAPGSTGQLMPWLFFGGIFSVSVLLFGFALWKAVQSFVQKRYVSSTLYSGLPLFIALCFLTILNLFG